VSRLEVQEPAAGGVAHKSLGRLPGLKFMRTLWVCNISGGPYKFTATKPGAMPLGLEEAHWDLRISPAEFDEVAAELGRTLEVVKVPKHERDEVLSAFAAHKDEVTAGYVAVAKRGWVPTARPSLHLRGEGGDDPAAQRYVGERPRGRVVP